MNRNEKLSKDWRRQHGRPHKTTWGRGVKDLTIVKFGLHTAFGNGRQQQSGVPSSPRLRSAKFAIRKGGRIEVEHLTDLQFTVGYDKAVRWFKISLQHKYMNLWGLLFSPS